MAGKKADFPLLQTCNTISFVKEWFPYSLHKEKIKRKRTDIHNKKFQLKFYQKFAFIGTSSGVFYIVAQWDGEGLSIHSFFFSLLLSPQQDQGKCGRLTWVLSQQ